MRIGLMTDLHLGLSGRPTWYNRLLGDHAETIAATAVEALQRAGVDLVVILGDISNAGLASELESARGIFSALRMPWYVIPGNHDADAVRSGAFDAAFGPHAARGYLRCGEVGMLFVRDTSPDGSPASTSFLVGSGQSSELATVLAGDEPRAVMVFTHAPLLSAKTCADTHGGKYAGHFADGADLLGRLAAGGASCRPMAFCGHLHFHHVIHAPRWAQCVTGALIEYPMEFRAVTLVGDTVKIETLPSVSPGLQAESLISADTAWVAGEPRDRQWEGVGM